MIDNSDNVDNADTQITLLLRVFWFVILSQLSLPQGKACASEESIQYSARKIGRTGACGLEGFFASSRLAEASLIRSGMTDGQQKGGNMSSFLYNSAKYRILQGAFDFTNDEFKVALVTAAYTPDKDAHEYFADITNEVIGTNYTAGGKVLQSIVLARDDANDRAILDAANLTWSVASFIARAAVIYKSTGNPQDSPLLAYIDFEEDLEAMGEDFILQWHEDGILALGE